MNTDLNHTFPNIGAVSGDCEASTVVADQTADTQPQESVEPAAEATASIGEAPTLFQPFPVMALPDPVRQYVVEAADAIGCDPSFVALPLLASLAAAIGNTRRIALKPDWAEPCVLLAGIVGDSGTKKTPALYAATSFLSDIQNDALAANNGQLADYELELLRYEGAVSKWKKSGGGNPPGRPAEPVAQRFIVSDTTIEALGDLLKHAPRGLLVERDELAGWLKSFDQYKGGKGSDVAHWLSLYNAKPLRIDRKTGSPKLVFVERASVSIAGGIQPETLRRALGAENFENGLAARLLLTLPPKRTGRWTEATVDPKLKREMALLFEHLLLLDFRLDSDGHPQPIDLPLTAGAKSIWIDFFNRHGGEQEELTGKEAALWSKLEGTAPRLALIVNVVREASGDPSLVETDKVDEFSMAAGIDLADWFGAEGRRIYRIFDESQVESIVRHVVELIARNGGAMTVRDLMRSQRRYGERSQLALGALESVVKAGWGRWEDVKAGETGGRPTRCVVLLGRSADADETPLNPVSGEGCVSVSASMSAGDVRIAA